MVARVRPVRERRDGDGDACMRCGLRGWLDWLMHACAARRVMVMVMAPVRLTLVHSTETPRNTTVQLSARCKGDNAPRRRPLAFPVACGPGSWLPAARRAGLYSYYYRDDEVTSFLIVLLITGRQLKASLARHRVTRVIVIA